MPLAGDRLLEASHGGSIAYVHKHMFFKLSRLLCIRHNGTDAVDELHIRGDWPSFFCVVHGGASKSS